MSSWNITRTLCEGVAASAKYRPIIGLEVHAQITLRTKLFSGAAFSDGSHANTCVTLHDMAMPGTLPLLNKSAVLKGVLTGVLLHCVIPKRCHFVRKHYFYPDMPAGYQITQQDHPIAHSGYFDFFVHCDEKDFEAYKKRVDICRVQLENDSGRSIHDLCNHRSLIDLNRSGVALLEIVTSPCMHSALEAYCFAEQLRLLLKENDICNGEMQKGQFRVDANVSLELEGGNDLGTRTEIKNLSSLRILHSAVNNELKRHLEILLSGGQVINETRTVDRFGSTVSMREKEIETDYRFMRETNLPSTLIKQEWINDARKRAKRPRFLKNIDLYGMDVHKALEIESDESVANFVESALHLCKESPIGRLIAEWIPQIRTICRSCNETFPPSEECIVENIVETLRLYYQRRLTHLTTYDLIRKSIKNELHVDVHEVVSSENLWMITDLAVATDVVTEVLLENKDLVKKCRSSKKKSHFTKLRNAALSRCNKRIELDILSEIMEQKLRAC